MHVCSVCHLPVPAGVDMHAKCAVEPGAVFGKSKYVDCSGCGKLLVPDQIHMCEEDDYDDDDDDYYYEDSPIYAKKLEFLGKLMEGEFDNSPVEALENYKDEIVAKGEELLNGTWSPGSAKAEQQLIALYDLVGIEKKLVKAANEIAVAAVTKKVLKKKPGVYPSLPSIQNVPNDNPEIGGTVMLITDKKDMARQHQMAVFVDVTAKAQSNENFRERASRMLGGTVNLPNTMKADVFALADDVVGQFQKGADIPWSSLKSLAADVAVNEQAAEQFAKKLGFVGFVVIRPTGAVAN